MSVLTHIFCTSMLLSSRVLDLNPSPTFTPVLSADKLQVQGHAWVGTVFSRRKGQLHTP